MTEALKPLPCPFCGAEAQYDNADERWGGQWYGCTECPAKTVVSYDQDPLPAWNRRVTQPVAPGWISVKDRLPEDRQSVAFVVQCGGKVWGYLNGRVLGGNYSQAYGGFSVPGLTVPASLWMPLPSPPTQPAEGKP